MHSLVDILDTLQHEINSGTICELEKERTPLSYLTMNQHDLNNEFADLTKAIIETIRENDFQHLKTFLGWLCKTRLEQHIKLSDIMAVFDLYEKSLKDAMSLYLQADLVSLNRFRRDIDALLDKARVYVSECFFMLYESTVFKQFEQLHIINEISARLTSSLKLHEVLNFIVTNAMHLFKSDCGSISTTVSEGIFVTQISHGWQEENSSDLIVNSVLDTSGIVVMDARNLQAEALHPIFDREKLGSVVAIKLHIKDSVLGILVIGFRYSRQFTQMDEKLLVTFANHAAIAINNAQLYGDTDQKLQDRMHDITFLLEQNRAILQSMREGVIAIDTDGYITLVNTEALRLINFTSDIIGKHIEQIIPNSRLPIIVKTLEAEYDQEQTVGNKFIITNRVPVIVKGKVTGAIATFRDKEDVKLLAEELIGVKNLLESMRAQSHEFMNKLHAISGLIQLGQYDKVVELITELYKAKQDVVSFLVKRIKDKATVGLLLGKISQAQEQGLTLRINPRSKLAGLPENFRSISMVTVLGNLITNAIEAVAGLPNDRKVIDVSVGQTAKYLNIVVRDCGYGVPPQNIKKIFQRGFSTKQGGRGFGLALVQQEVELSGGRIFVHSVENQGSRFVVKIPNRCETKQIN